MKTATTDVSPQQGRRQQTSPYLSGQMPSYASPTMSSTAKMVSVEPAKSPSSPQKCIKRTLPHRDFKTFRLSTEASRSRSRCQGPFRFLDLPADIRNMIYEYVPVLAERHTTSYASHKSATANSGPYAPYSRLFTKPLPALLLVKSKQIREEFGSYVFTQTGLRFTSLNRNGLADLFRFIGFINCKRLIDNADVTVKIFDMATLLVQRRGELQFWKDLTWEDLSNFMNVNTLWKR